MVGQGGAGHAATFHTMGIHHFLLRPWKVSDFFAIDLEGADLERIASG